MINVGQACVLFNVQYVKLVASSSVIDELATTNSGGTNSGETKLIKCHVVITII
jgi:hypothetical protein